MRDEPSYVIDASALLAMLHGEEGADVVEEVIPGAFMSAVNWSEVVQKSVARGVDVSGLRADVEALGLSIYPFTAADGDAAGVLWTRTKRAGLSLGDRACLALALRLGSEVVTAERLWARLRVGVKVRAIR